MRFARPRRWLLAAAAAGSVTLTLSGLTTAHASTPPTPSMPPRSLQVVATDYHFALNAAVIHAGLVRIQLRNDGHMYHQVQLARLHPGATLQQFLADMRAGKETAAYGLVDFTGGVNAILPGTQATAYSQLPDGRYLALCFVPGPHGVPHLLLGMTATFAVTGPMDHRSPTHVAGTIDAYNFGFALPQFIHPHGLYRFVDATSTDLHELAILRLAPGKTIIDFVDWLQAGLKGTPPVIFDGGSGVVQPGKQDWIRLNLAPGNYIATCFVHDDETGMPHALMGMITPFHVAAEQ